MSEPLEIIINHLLKTTGITLQDLKHNYNFINGCLTTEYHESGVQPCNGLLPANRYEIIKKMCNVLEENASILQDLENHEYNGSEKSSFDLKTLIRSLQHFAKLRSMLIIHESAINENSEFKERVFGIILKKCPTYLMLSSITSAPLATGYSITIFADHENIAPVIIYAYLLHKAGLPNGVLNVIQYDEEKMVNNNVLADNIVYGIIPKTVNLVKTLKLAKLRSVLVQDAELSSPIVILKTADVDSAVNCIVNLVPEQNGLWRPNIIYVESVVYNTFVNTLKFVTKLRNKKIENQDCNINDSTVQSICGKTSSEVIVLRTGPTTHCYFVLDCDLHSEDSKLLINEKYHFITVIPIRSTPEVITMVNKKKSCCVSLWTNDALQATSLFSKLTSGTVWVNSASYYDYNIPLSHDWSYGVGSFFDKSSFLELLKFDYPIVQTQQDTGLYPVERNSLYPRKNLSEVIQISIKESLLWSKVTFSDRQSTFEDLYMRMENSNWLNHIQLVMNETDSQCWKLVLKYVKYWSSFSQYYSEHLQLLHARECYVHVTREPLGVIAIVLNSAPLDALFFLILGALVYGNTVILGVCADSGCSMIVNEIESFFKTGLVMSVYANTKSLLNSFLQNEKIAGVWGIKKFINPELLSSTDDGDKLKRVVLFDHLEDMTKFVYTFHLYTTKTKTLWLPTS